MSWRLVPCCLSIAVLAGSASATPRLAHPKPKTLATVRDTVGALAQSNHRLAWLRGPATCPKAEVFDLRTRHATRINSRRGAACNSENGSAYGVLAFDGNRILWQMASGGNLSTTVTIFTAAFGDRRTRVLGAAEFDHGGGGIYYYPPPPMAAGPGRLMYFAWCVAVDCRGVRAVVGRRSRLLFTAVRPVSLSLAGANLAVLEDDTGCCNSNPVWSPDGTKLAWVNWGERTGGLSTELVSARADGTERHVLARGGLSVAGWSAGWSPDGSRLVFSRSPNTSLSTVAVVKADGTEERTLVQGGSPVWSPDGIRIAFVRGNDLYRIDSDGTDEATLTHDAVPRTGKPQWSSDGKKLVAVRGSPSRVYVIDAVSGAETILPPINIETTPAWSPDGTRIAFSADRSLAVMNIDGSGFSRLTDNSSTGFEDEQPAWSPDGTAIAFTRGAYEPPFEDTTAIFVVGDAGQALHQISPWANASGPAWAPDGHTLAWGDYGYSRAGGVFTARADGNGGLARVAGGASAPVQIRNSRTGAVLRSFVAPDNAVSIAMSARFVGVVVWDGSRLQLRRYRRDGSFLGSGALPKQADPSLVSAGGAFVYSIPRRILSVDAEKGRTRVLAATSARPVGLSVFGGRAVWAENLGRRGARIRALALR
jgi:Tol biopolymer transport system component